MLHTLHVSLNYIHWHHLLTLDWGHFLKPFCKKEKLYPEQVRYGGPKTNLKFRGFIDQMEFWNLSYLKDLEILMHVKKKFTLLAAQEAEKSTKTFSVDWVEPAIIAFNSNILSITFASFVFCLFCFVFVVPQITFIVSYVNYCDPVYSILLEISK